MCVPFEITIDILNALPLNLGNVALAVKIHQLELMVLDCIR
jgi:hypothetical protein